MKIGLCDRMATGWIEEFREACKVLGHEACLIKIGADDWMEQLKGVEIFVWRLIMGDPSGITEARTKLPMIEEMGIPCFPNQKMLWLYDDKIRESYFLRLHQYPTPRTWIFFDGEMAKDFVSKATYPMVAKSHCGASASGVVILRTAMDAEIMRKKIFKKWTLLDMFLEKYYYLPRLAKGDLLLQLKSRYRGSWPRYVYYQTFVKTSHDWRVTTLGKDLVSVFVRKNRPDDFRASGSGIWEKVEEKDVPVEACDLALKISHDHGFTSMTFDFMRDEEKWVIGEMSYTFMLNAIYSNTLFRKVGDRYIAAEPRPIGVMHIEAIIERCGRTL